MYIEYGSGNKYPYRDAEVSGSMDSFDDCGYVLNDDEVVIDIDCLSKDIIKIIIDEFNIKTHTVWTDRGVHFYFKKPVTFRRAKGVCALGFEVEFKTSSNTKSVVVKRGGVSRDSEYAGVREELPDIFRVNKRFDNLLGLGDGSGRNNALFALRGRLMGVKEWKKILVFVNKYIFAEPLGDDEIEVLTREMVLKGGDNNEHEFARVFTVKYGIVMFAGQLFFRYGGKYKNDINLLRRLVLKACGEQRTRYVDEVIKQLEYSVPLIKEDTTFDIKFNNGILRNGEFLEVEYDEFTPFSVELDYNKNAKSVDIVDEYVDNLTSGERGYRELLFEILGHMFVTDREFKRLVGKFFFFVGDGGNGKGTLLEIIRGIVGRQNCSSLSVTQLADYRYFYNTINKMVNLGDDIEDEAINNNMMKQLKNISTCDVIGARRMYEMAVEVQPTVTLIFTSNHILKSFEKGTSYQRRVVWLPMYYKPKVKDPQFISKLTTIEAREYFLKMIIEGYMRLYKNCGFSSSKIVDDFNEDYHIENNSAVLYVNDLKDSDLEGVVAREIYDDYKLWAEDNDASKSLRQLRELIKEYKGYEVRPARVNGRVMRVFTKK